MVETPSIRPLAGPPDPGRYAPPERREAAPTELPPVRSADPAAGDRAVGAEARRRGPDGGAAGAGARPALEAHFTIDRETRDLVFRAVDSASGAVVLQSPDEAVLRLRAYRLAAEAAAARRAGPDPGVRQEA